MYNSTTSELSTQVSYLKYLRYTKNISYIVAKNNIRM